MNKRHSLVGARHAVPLLLLHSCLSLLHAAEPESTVITPNTATRDAFSQFANLLETLQKQLTRQTAASAEPKPA